MELETKYKITREKAESLIYRAAVANYRMDGVLLNKDEYFNTTDNIGNKRFRLRSTKHYASPSMHLCHDAYLDKCVTLFLDNSQYDNTDKSILEGYWSNSYTFTVKDKTVTNGIEQNKEEEFQIDDNGLSALLSLLDYANMKKQYTKYKKTFSFYLSCNDITKISVAKIPPVEVPTIHVELVNFQGRFWMEMEIILKEDQDDTDSETSLEDMKNAIPSWFEYVITIFGISPSMKDNRSWGEIEKEL